MYVVRTGLVGLRRLRVSPSGRYLVASGARASDTEPGYEVWDLPPKSRPAHASACIYHAELDWSPLADELHVLAPPFVRVVAPSGKLVQALPGNDWAGGFALAAAGDWLVIQNPFRLTGLRRRRNRWASGWTVDYPAPTPSGSRRLESFHAVAAGPGGRFVAVVYRGRSGGCGQESHALIEYDTATGRALAERVLADDETPRFDLSRLHAAPDGTSVIGFRARSVRIWPTDPALKNRRVGVSKRDVLDVALSPDGRRLLVADGSPNVALWDAQTWTPLGAHDWGVGPVRCVAYSPDGLMAAAGGMSGRVAVFDAEG